MDIIWNALMAIYNIIVGFFNWFNSIHWDILFDKVAKWVHYASQCVAEAIVTAIVFVVASFFKWILSKLIFLFCLFMYLIPDSWINNTYVLVQFSQGWFQKADTLLPLHEMFYALSYFLLVWAIVVVGKKIWQIIP